MAIIPRPDILYLQSLQPSNMVWAYNQQFTLSLTLNQTLSTFFSSSPWSFSNKNIRTDLELDPLVDHAFTPRFSPDFVKKAFASPPTGLEIILERQKTLESLSSNTSQRELLSDVEEMLYRVITTMIDLDEKRRIGGYSSSSGQMLAGQVTVLTSYIHSVEALSQFSQGSEIFRSLAAYGSKISESDEFKELKRYVDAFTNEYKVTLEVVVDSTGYVQRTSVLDIDVGKKFTPRGLRNRLKLMRLHVSPHEVVSSWINTIYERNKAQMSEFSLLLGPLDFYSSLLRFYDEMEKKNVPLTLPEMLPMERREAFIPAMRNPLLLFQKGDNDTYLIDDGGDIIPNDVSYNHAGDLFHRLWTEQRGKDGVHQRPWHLCSPCTQRCKNPLFSFS